MGSKKLVEEFDSEIANVEVSSQDSSGGDNASEPEVPFIPGFKLTEGFLKEFLTRNNLDDFFEDVSDDIGDLGFANLNRIGERFRSQVKNSDMPTKLEEKLLDNYKEFQNTLEEEKFKVKVSIEEDNSGNSYVAEDPKELIESVKNCCRDFFDNLMVEKILKEDKDIENYLSNVNIVWKPVQPNLVGKASSSIEKNQKGNTIYIEALQGECSSEFYVFKENLRIIKKKENEDNSNVFRENQVKKLAKYIYQLEKQHKNPIEVSWIFNKKSKEFYITKVQEKKARKSLKLLKFQENTETLLTGDIERQSVTNGQVVKLNSHKEVDKVSENSIVVTDKITENWKHIVSKAEAVVTNRQINGLSEVFSRNTPIITNTRTATSDLNNDDEITVDGYNGEVLKGNPIREIQEIDSEKEFTKEEDLYLNISNIDKGLKASKLDLGGVHIEPDLAAKEIGDIGVLASSFYPRKVFVHLKPDKNLEEQKNVLNHVESFLESGLDNISLVFYSKPSLNGNIKVKKDLRTDYRFEDLDVFLGLDRPITMGYIGELDDYFDGYVLNFRRYAKNILGVEKGNLEGLLSDNRELIEEKFIEDFEDPQKEILLYSEGEVVNNNFLSYFDGVSTDLYHYNKLRKFLESSERDKGGELLNLDAPVRIGDAAEDLAELLDKEDSFSEEDLLDKLDSDLDHVLVNQALGWLAKEDKIEILTKDGDILYRRKN